MRDALCVDCIVLNYNDADTTINMVNGIRDYGIFNHIIMVDNCSTDGSADRLADITDEKVILIRNTQNTGYGAGNNLGVYYSHTHYNGDFAVIANPDVEFTEDCIQALVDEMLRDRKLAVIAPVQKDTKGNVVERVAWPLPTVWRTIFSGGRILKNRLNKPYTTEYLIEYAANPDVNSVSVDCVPGAMLMVNTKTFCTVLNGYDEKNFLYGEENMLGRKVKNFGLKAALDFRETYIHKHAVSITKSYPSEVNRKKLLLDAKYFYLKNYTDANRFQLWIARCMFKFYLFEKKISMRVKMLWRK